MQKYKTLGVLLLLLLLPFLSSLPSLQSFSLCSAVSEQHQPAVFFLLFGRKPPTLLSSRATITRFEAVLHCLNWLLFVDFNFERSPFLCAFVYSSLGDSFRHLEEFLLLQLCLPLVF